MVLQIISGSGKASSCLLFFRRHQINNPSDSHYCNANQRRPVEMVSFVCHNVNITNFCYSLLCEESHSCKNGQYQTKYCNAYSNFFHNECFKSAGCHAKRGKAGFIYYGFVTIFASRTTAVCASALPLIDAPV